MSNELKPRVKLIGEDGNAFNIIGRCLRVARAAGWNQTRIDAVLAEMKSGDYNHLLATAMDHFNVR